VDTYFPAFEISIREGGARGIMYAVNEINGVPSDANVMLDNKLKEWGFDGYRATDGGQVCLWNEAIGPAYSCAILVLPH
jgi:beta-glucosidase